MIAVVASIIDGKESIKMELKGIFEGDDPVLKLVFQEKITTLPTYGSINVVTKYDACICVFY